MQVNKAREFRCRVAQLREPTAGTDNLNKHDSLGALRSRLTKAELSRKRVEKMRRQLEDWEHAMWRWRDRTLREIARLENASQACKDAPESPQTG